MPEETISAQWGMTTTQPSKNIDLLEEGAKFILIIVMVIAVFFAPPIIFSYMPVGPIIVKSFELYECNDVGYSYEVLLINPTDPFSYFLDPESHVHVGDVLEVSVLDIFLNPLLGLYCSEKE